MLRFVPVRIGRSDFFDGYLITELLTSSASSNTMNFIKEPAEK